jgi:dTDP-4-dehydrorhamnose reductase
MFDNFPFDFINVTIKMQSVLLYGCSGWIGNKLKDIFENNNFNVICAKARLDNERDIRNEVDNTEFDYCVLCAGITRDPSNISSNIDWCESNITKTININTFGCAFLVRECSRKGKPTIYLGTGCIYEYNLDHPIPTPEWTGKDLGYFEDDVPNFDKSIYSLSKIKFEEEISQYDTLILRIRMPIDYSFHPRNFISKISKYEKVVNIPNSVSVLEDLLVLIPRMLNMRGKINLVNPGVISHNEILDLYTKIVDPSFTYQNFTPYEQSKVIKAPRSNNALNTNKLQELFPEVPHIKDSIITVMNKLKELKNLD